MRISPTSVSVALAQPAPSAAQLSKPANLRDGDVHAETGNAVEVDKGGFFLNRGRITTADSNSFKQSHNGISVGGTGGTLMNLGYISGGSNGIKTTHDAVLLNMGEITGRKGAGLKSKGDATILNYGVITGADTRRPNQDDGDGDGLDIDRIAHIHNYGVIKGTGANGKDKGGIPNSSEGIAMGGGAIFNHRNALISGVHHGILVDNGDLGDAYGDTRLNNQGKLLGLNGYGVKLIGDFDDFIINGGLIAGGNGIALDMGGGNDLLMLERASRFDGTVDGGSGINQVILNDPDGGQFEGAKQMQHLWVAAGTWTLTGTVDANTQGQVYDGATLINRSRIGGSMKIEPAGTYTGGTVGNLTVAGTLLSDPQASTRIEKDLKMKHGSSLICNIGADETHSTLRVGNTAALGGATLNIEVQHESDALLNRQLRIVNAKRVEGEFGSITSNLKAFTPELIYTATGAFVAFKRKNTAVV